MVEKVIHSADVGLPSGPDEPANRMAPAVDAAYTTIRHLIVCGDLPAGTKLQEAMLAERIGVSRTPVRQALQRLGVEGLVVLERYRESFVAQFTRQDAEEIFRLRAVLEGQAAGRAATRITPEQIAQLEQIEEQMEQRFVELGWHQHLEEFDRLNNDFHQTIVRAADSPRLVKILESSLALPASIFNTYGEPGDVRTKRTHAQHREIIEALKSRNSKWAAAQMEAHLISVLGNVEM